MKHVFFDCSPVSASSSARSHQKIDRHSAPAEYYPLTLLATPDLLELRARRFNARQRILRELSKRMDKAMVLAAEEFKESGDAVVPELASVLDALVAQRIVA